MVERLTTEQRERPDGLIAVPDGAPRSPFDRLRDGPYIQSGAEIGRGLARLDEIRAPAAGLPQVERLSPGSRTATLLALIRTLEATAGDDVIDLFDAVATTMSPAAR